MAQYGMLKLYGIANCDTVKKARLWLTKHGVEHQFYDFKKLGVPVDRLPLWASAVGHDRLLNRQGTTWRKLAAAEQASAGDSTGALALMLAHPSLIKRPVVEWAGEAERISVGFDADQWQTRL